MEKFASLNAKTRFDEFYNKRTFLADLGFILIGDTPHPLPSECRDAIRILNLESYFIKRIQPDSFVVREFYANLWPNNVYTVFVRGKQAHLNSMAINQLFDLPNNNNNDYFPLFSYNTDEMSDRLLWKVTIPGTQWIRSNKDNLTCQREHLITKAKVWFYFIRHSLMPTGHTSSLNI